MLVKDLLAFISQECKMDDEIYISDNYGACAEISYFDRTEVHDWQNPKVRKCLTLNIVQRIDFRKPEEY